MPAAPIRRLRPIGPIFTLAASLLVLAFAAHAQSLDTQTPYTEVSRGPHHRVMRRTWLGTDPYGYPEIFTSAYTELATGLSRLSSAGEWVPASDQIHVTPQGAAATNAQHSVWFNANLADGITIGLPDGQIMRGAPLFISYFDDDNLAVIANLQDSVGQLLPSLNQVIFTNAFTN